MNGCMLVDCNQLKSSHVIDCAFPIEPHVFPYSSMVEKDYEHILNESMDFAHAHATLFLQCGWEKSSNGIQEKLWPYVVMR